MTPKDITRLQHINYDKFAATNMGEGGPINLYQFCGFVTKKYRNHYDQINWGKKENKKGR